jgi:DNA-binding CsgD family transcriptional regulator
MIEWQKRDRPSDRPPPDLGALNPAEREALLLLAEGHTAKSIAALTGRSPAAVNERLREARRKTGIGSSRELARLLAAAHKNRDEKIDLAVVSGNEAAPVPPGRIGWRKGRIVMPLMLVAGIAAVLIAAQSKHGATIPAHIPPDPLIAHFVAPEFDVAGLHERVRTEQRDAAWAMRTEQGLAARYAMIPHVNDMGKVRVLCGSTLCEVANLLPDPKTLPESANAILYRDLQSTPLFHDGAALGLRYEGQLFSETKDQPKRNLFVAYWSRPLGKRPADPRLDRQLPPVETGERGYYDRIRAENRDAEWAERTEAGLHKLLNPIPGLHRVVARCAVSLCELSATTGPDPSPAAREAFDRNLQTWDFANGLERLGLKHGSTQFTVGAYGQGIYIAYYLRNGA